MLLAAPQWALCCCFASCTLHAAWWTAEHFTHTFMSKVAESSRYEQCRYDKCLLWGVSPLGALWLMLPFSTIMSNVFMSSVFMTCVVMTNTVAPMKPKYSQGWRTQISSLSYPSCYIQYAWNILCVWTCAFFLQCWKTIESHNILSVRMP